jgi:hypothetical protein
MRILDRLAWPFIGAAALAAMVCGHALELWLESARVFGDSRANYAHSVQSFAVEAAAALCVIALASVAQRLLRTALRGADDADTLVPALGSVVRLGFARTGLAVVGAQFCALIGIELLEQSWSGFGGGVAVILGPGHATAIAVHVIVGLVCALALHRVSRFVCTRDSIIAGALATFLRQVSLRHCPAPAATFHPVNLWASDRKPPLLALGLANRPPPVSSANAT